MTVAQDVDPSEAGDLGSLIREARERAGLRQTDVAAAVHVGLSSVAAWETGRHAPSAAVMPALAAILGVELTAGTDGQWTVRGREPEPEPVPSAPPVVVVVASTAEAMREALDRLGVPRAQ